MAGNRLFIGHYVGNPEEWFLAWGETIEQAAVYVDCENGEPDLDSMREVVGPGFIEFKTKLDPDVEDEPPIVEYEASGSLSLGGGEGIDENDDWIRERMQDPLGEPNESTELRPMGITQRRLADAYLKGSDD